MQTQMSSSSINQKPGFDQMAQSLSGALAEFADQSPAMWSTLAEYPMKALNFTTGYVRRHPVQAAIGLAAVGLLAAQLFRRAGSLMPQSSKAEADLPQSLDGRQY